MSDVAIAFVKDLAKKKTGPDGKPLSSAELRVLKVLAYLHNEYVWCAWPAMSSVAMNADMHESTARRTLAGLVKRGVLRRYFVTSERWQEATSNEYEFVGLGFKEVSQQDRDVVFKYKRTRSAIQLSLRRGGRKRKVVAAEGCVAELEAVAGLDAAPRAEGDVCLPASDASVAQETDVCVDFSVHGVVGGNPESCGGQLLQLPVELYTELELDLLPPHTPPPSVSSVEKPAADTFVELYLNMGRAKATASASASAKATTSSLRSPAVSMERVGGSGARSGAGRPQKVRGQRQPRDLEARRRLLDDEDAAVLDEAVRVLQGCGVSETTRSLCNAVIGALRLRVEQTGCTLSDAGRFAIARWREYVSFAWAIFRPVGVRRFFGSGMWLDDNLWGWDKQAIRDRKQESRSGIGAAEL